MYLFKRMVLIALFGIGMFGCTTNHNIQFPNELLFQSQPEKMPITVGIYIPPEDKALPFDQCEKLIGGSMCYHGVAGALLGPSALQAFQQRFDQVVLLDSLTDSQALNADFVVALSYSDVHLDTTLDGTIATRKVAVTLREQVFSKGNALSDRELSESTSCVAYQCKIDGNNVGHSGTEVVLKTLFLPGYLFGTASRYSKTISTAYGGSLKTVLLRSVEDLYSRAKEGPA